MNKILHEKAYQGSDIDAFQQDFDTMAFCAAHEVVDIDIPASFFVMPFFPTAALVGPELEFTKKQVKRDLEDLKASLLDDMIADGVKTALLVSLSNDELKRVKKESKVKDKTVRTREHTMRIARIFNGEINIVETDVLIFGHLTDDAELDQNGKGHVTSILASKETAPLLRAALRNIASPN